MRKKHVSKQKALTLIDKRINRFQKLLLSASYDKLYNQEYCLLYDGTLTLVGELFSKEEAETFADTTTIYPEKTGYEPTKEESLEEYQIQLNLCITRLQVYREKIQQFREDSPPSKENAVAGTRTDKCIKKIKDRPVISVLIVIGIVIISLGAVVGGLDKIVSFWNKIIHKQVDSQRPSQNIMDTRIITATATVEITIMSGEKGKKNYIIPGTHLKFAKGREALLVMLSKECTSEQTGKNSVRYTSNMSLEVPSRALKKPLSLLKQAEYLQICLKPIPSKSYILSGKAFCVFNGNIPIEITIPQQKMSNEIITVRDLDVAFNDIR